MHIWKIRHHNFVDDIMVLNSVLSCCWQTTNIPIMVCSMLFFRFLATYKVTYQDIRNLTWCVTCFYYKKTFSTIFSGKRKCLSLVVFSLARGEWQKKEWYIVVVQKEECYLFSVWEVWVVLVVDLYCVSEGDSWHIAKERTRCWQKYQIH